MAALGSSYVLLWLCRPSCASPQLPVHVLAALLACTGPGLVHVLLDIPQDRHNDEGLDWTHVEPAGLGRAGFWGAWTSQLEKHSASRGELQISGHYIVVACPERMEPVGPPLASAQSNQNPGVCV